MLKILSEEEVIPITVKRGPTGVRPIIPTGDTCCSKVCTIINEEIDSIEQAIGLRQEQFKISAYGAGRLKTKRQISALTNKVTALKDMRFAMREKDSCKCIEDVPSRKIQMPVIKKP